MPNDVKRVECPNCLGGTFRMEQWQVLERGRRVLHGAEWPVLESFPVYICVVCGKQAPWTTINGQSFTGEIAYEEWRDATSTD